MDLDVRSGDYTPYPTLALLSAPKGMGVPRFIPVFTLRDYAVFFGCVRAIDEQLAENATPGTFGGWSLGGARRRAEGIQAKTFIKEAVDDYYGPPSAYNPAAWVKNWNEFWKLLLLGFREADDDSCFVMFDVANFYDSIDLTRLERQIRDICPGENLPIEVLFFLLGAWNNRQTSYSRSSKGLPQDVIGDCSRVLANGYLIPYDRAVRARAEAVSATRYMRYADDMVISAPSQRDCERMLLFAAEELNRLGLNINVSKVKYLRRAEFNAYWGFDVMTALETKATLAHGVRLLRERWDDGAYHRRDTAARRALGLLTQRPDLQGERAWLHEQLMAGTGQLVALSERQMAALVLIAARPRQALARLTEVAASADYSSPKLRLIRCAEMLQDTPGLKAACLRVPGALGGEDADPAVRQALQRSSAWRR
ncbi:MAG: RNA-directed DNA polymerase [Dehalococcoidia bacterium]|nr:RNA-directed DNA polymerase [Dehalococcoidia bacterium]